ncbi:MAG: VOC family protein [Acidobacteriota bacterium]
MKLSWMVAGVVLAAAALLPAQQANQNPAELTGISHIAFRVSDVDQEANFFGKLGYEEAFSHVVDGHALAVILKINDRQFIELFPRTDANQPLGLMRVCYETPDLKALRAHYQAEGLRPTLARPSPENNIIFSVLDTDSRQTEFTQYLPEGRQMMDRGQHLGDSRVSDELIGFEMPVTNVTAGRSFYEKLGFTAEADGHNVRLTLPANEDLHIELHPARANDQPQFLFPVDDARRAADQLKRQKLRVVRDKKLLFVQDPDGNSFVLMQAGDPSPRHLIPWHR